jgi:hypothetical protein
MQKQHPCIFPEDMLNITQNCTVDCGMKQGLEFGNSKIKFNLVTDKLKLSILIGTSHYKSLIFNKNKEKGYQLILSYVFRLLNESTPICMCNDKE